MMILFMCIIRLMKFTACLLGDMWAQSWERLDDFTRPYPTIDDVNPTSAMINQVINALLMFILLVQIGILKEKNIFFRLDLSWLLFV